MKTIPKKIVCLAVLVLGCISLSAQNAAILDLRGTLQLVDRPAAATPVEALTFRLHPLSGGYDLQAQPDRDGKFILKNVRPGRYSLTFPMPGRIQTFSYGSKELAPDGFEIDSGSNNSLLLIVSMKSSELSVMVRGFPSDKKETVALLVPADNRLTLRESCSLNQLTGPQTTFSFVPPGKYRIFIADAQFQQEISAYAPRLPDFMKQEATLVEVSANRKTETTATYLNNETVREAIQAARLNYPIAVPK